MSDTTDHAAFARQVLDYILEHPDEHDQTHWGLHPDGCGTTMCIAGTAVTLDPDTGVTWYSSESGQFMGTTVIVDDDPGPIEVRAAELLGLDETQSHELFFDSTDEEALDFLEVHVANLEALVRA